MIPNAGRGRSTWVAAKFIVNACTRCVNDSSISKVAMTDSKIAVTGSGISWEHNLQQLCFVASDDLTTTVFEAGWAILFLHSVDSTSIC